MIEEAQLQSILKRGVTEQSPPPTRQTDSGSKTGLRSGPLMTDSPGHVLAGSPYGNATRRQRSQQTPRANMMLVPHLLTCFGLRLPLERWAPRPAHGGRPYCAGAFCGSCKVNLFGLNRLSSNHRNKKQVGGESPGLSAVTAWLQGPAREAGHLPPSFNAESEFVQRERLQCEWEVIWKTRLTREENFINVFLFFEKKVDLFI